MVITSAMRIYLERGSRSRHIVGQKHLQQELFSGSKFRNYDFPLVSRRMLMEDV